MPPSASAVAGGLEQGQILRINCEFAKVLVNGVSKWVLGGFPVTRRKVCNREQQLTSLYAPLKKQTAPGAAFLHVTNLR